MPPAALIGIAEFVEEARDDYNSPTTSTFASRMPDCRQTISVLEEVRKNKSGVVFYFCLYVCVHIHTSMYLHKKIVCLFTLKVPQFQGQFQKRKMLTFI